MLNNANRSGKATGVDEKEPRPSDVRSGSTDGKPEKAVIRVKSTTKIVVTNGRLAVVSG
jgi:hypothetical protein